MAGCPLWVISGCCRLSGQCPPYPQKRTRALPPGMSAMGQKRTSAILFNQFVGAAEHRLRHGDAKRLRGLEVDNQFIFGRRLNRHVGRLFALQNAIDIGGCTPVLVNGIRAIRHKAAIGGVVTIGIDRRQSKPRRKWNDYVPWEARSSRRHYQTAVGGTRNRSDGAL